MALFLKKKDLFPMREISLYLNFKQNRKKKGVVCCWDEGFSPVT